MYEDDEHDRRASSTVPSPALEVTPRNCIRLIAARDLIRTLDNPAKLIFGNSYTGEIQRHLDADHVAALYRFQREKHDMYGHYFFPNPIFIAQLDEQFAVLDGQHRLEVARYLEAQDEPRASAAPLMLPVSVIKIESIEEHDDLFVALNKNKPVHIFRHNARDWKSVLKKLQQHFCCQYRAYLRKTDKPRAPHLNVDRLIEHMDKHNTVERIGLDFDALVDEIEALNQCYRLHWSTLLRDTRYVPNVEHHVDACVRKGGAHPLFLGLFTNFEWLRRIEHKVRDHVPYEAMHHVRDTYRPRITKRLRREVWRKRNGDALQGACYVCAATLEYDDAECGHKQAVCMGGATCADNLEPICRACNSEMRAEHLDDFRARWQREHVSEPHDGLAQEEECDMPRVKSTA